MPGEFLGACSETLREIWLPLIDDEGVPEDIFCGRFGEPVLEPFRPDSTTLGQTPQPTPSPTIDLR